MLYGIKDLITYFFGLKPEYSSLRKKEFWALQNINFHIYENDIVILAGLNGSGKTTLTKMLAGIYETERGTIEYHTKIKKIISVFAIKSGFNPILTGRENVYLKAAYYGMSRKEIDENMDFIISFSEIGSFLDTPIGKYSSGMKTRLAMSLVLSIKSDILFIDEAFSFSDSKFKTKCFKFLKEEYSNKGRALIIATHRFTEISDLANRLIVLEKGKIINMTVDVVQGIKDYTAN
ncbi:ABC transporter ATP-binding protein [Dokdonia ponticola]|uniref:ABC transporter ATP-binding protein n=1 Tax=Dokdonia ponticola TaxID=2041041 RepID=A0ABV9HW92_9FLAO